MKNKFNLELFLIYILVPQFLGLLSAFFAGNIGYKYSMLIKPPFSPGKSLFSIVWFIIYILMGIAAYLVHNEKNRDDENAKFFYSAQLGINFLWNILFFGLEKRFFSFLWIIFLLIVLIKCFKEFNKINKTASLLLIPYIIWIIYAGYLNFGFWFLNK